MYIIISTLTFIIYNKIVKIMNPDFIHTLRKIQEKLSKINAKVISFYSCMCNFSFSYSNQLCTNSAIDSEEQITLSDNLSK